MTKTETKAEKEARELFDVKQACAETKKRRKAALKKQAEGEVEVQRLENEYKEAFSHIPTILKAATDSWEVAHDGEVQVIKALDNAKHIFQAGNEDFKRSLAELIDPIMEFKHQASSVDETGLITGLKAPSSYVKKTSTSPNTAE